MSRYARRAKGARRGLTFKVLVVVPFCIALAIQGIACVVALNRSAVLEQMEADAYDLFSERVESRAGYLENDMMFQWSSFDSVVDQVDAHIVEQLNARSLTASDLQTGSEAALACVEAVSGDVLSLVQRLDVDGAFVVLANGDTSHGEDGHTALYVRDSNPTLVAENDADLMLAACPISVGRNLGLALDSQWSATFPLAAEGQAQSAFYYEPVRAAENYPDAVVTDLGYWGHPVDLGWAGTPSITYSMPLRDAQGGVVGVLGVEVQINRVMALFPYTDLSDEGDGSYILAATGEEGGFARDGGVEPLAGVERSYTVLASSGATQSLYIEGGEFSAALDESGRMTIEKAADSSARSRAVASAVELTLYDSTSPFASEHWALVGLESEAGLFVATRSLSQNLLVTFIISLAIGLIVAVITAWLSSSRLRQLMGEVRAARPEQPISFTPTGIVEVDELSESIEALGAEVASSASRLSQILRLSDHNVGAFEFNTDAQTVTCTDGFFDTLSSLGLPKSVDFGVKSLVNATLSVDEFEQMMRLYEPYLTKEDEGRYLIHGPLRATWVRLVIFVDEGDRRTYGLVEDVTHEIQTRQRIEHERDHDILTGLLNRRAFEQTVTQRLNDNPPGFAAMLMLDLDNLKFVNDTYGHDWGDHYIKMAARVMATSFKDSGLCSRISGDEFLAFVDGCANRAEAEKLFEKFVRALDASVLKPPDGKLLKVRASTGVAYYPDDATDFPHLREYADFAMYLAKNSRKGELVAFDREIYDQKSFMLNGKEELNRLFDEELVDFYFQPIVDVDAGEVVAYEALMRPCIDTIAAPDILLALARSQSKLYLVERLTFFGALEAYAQCEGVPGATLFVNSIATQRLSADDEVALEERFPDLLSRMVIEITENDYSREMAVYKEALAHRFGARLAIDDFGSGYNGETSLLDYRVDYVKLDMGIVRGIDTMKDHQDIAKNLINYAHDRGIRVIAEGVETEAELRELVVLGVDYLQGFLIARPEPKPRDIPEDVKQLIRSLSDKR